MKLSLLTAGAALIALTALAAPASAHPAAGLRKAVPAQAHAVHFRHHRHCHWRKVVRIDRFGHRRVKRVQVCHR
jgi:hypothetical protein